MKDLHQPAKYSKRQARHGFARIKDDLENAGAIWVDAPVGVDGNLISSRTPRDLPRFAHGMVQFLNQTQTQTTQTNVGQASQVSHAKAIASSKENLHAVFELNPDMIRKLGS
jgi:hypothetical protein